MIYDMNFDNIFNGFLYLFILSTGEGWYIYFYNYILYNFTILI
jgi:hypothetical protein